MSYGAIQVICLRNAVGSWRVRVLNVMETSVGPNEDIRYAYGDLRSYEGVERDVSNVLKKTLHNT